MRLDEFESAGRMEQTQIADQFEGFLRLRHVRFARLVQSSAEVC